MQRCSGDANYALVHSWYTQLQKVALSNRGESFEAAMHLKL